MGYIENYGLECKEFLSSRAAVSSAWAAPHPAHPQLPQSSSLSKAHVKTPPHSTPSCHPCLPGVSRLPLCQSA